MSKCRKLVSLIHTLFILCSITGCSLKPAPVFDINSVNSYTEIPGITQQEINAIEELKKQRQSFSFGTLSSSDAFWDSAGGYKGFSLHLCNTLSRLFGIPFVPRMLDWQDLKEGLDSFSVDFSASLNTTAFLDCCFFRTSPISGNKLSVFIREGSFEILSEYDLRGLKIGFFADSSSEEAARNAFPYVDFQSIYVNTSQEMADMLESKEIDAFIFDTPEIFSFYDYSHVAKAIMFQHIYIPVSISTANPLLEPFISAITKYLMAGGINEVVRLQEIGEREYASHVFDILLNDEERSYIAAMKASGEKIPVGFTAGRYPVAFYDDKSGSYQGIAKDVLDEISLLTGLEFFIPHDRSILWTELEGALRTGELKMLSQLIPNDLRREYAIWPEPYFSAKYALLSNSDYPYLSLNQVPYALVGLAAGTAEEAIYNLWFPDDKSYRTFRTNDEGLTALENGEIDLFFCLDYTLLYESNFRENAGQKVNILFDTPLEKVPFGININEEILCSIINKAQMIINTDRIVRSWTSHVFDMSSQMAKERVRILTIAVICLLVMLVAMLLSIIISFRLKRANAVYDQNFKTLMDLLPVGVRILSLDDWTLLYSNKACLEIFGCTSFEQQVEGRSGLGFMPEIQPDGRTTQEHLGEIFKTDRSIAELQCFKLNGEVFTCRMTSCTINYAGDKRRRHRASLAVMEDVTAERKARERLRDIASKEHEANQLKSRFLANMSHEIRTPMNAILGITEIQLHNESLPHDTHEALGWIFDSGTLLLNIINDILDLSKIEADKLEIVPVKYDISSLINDAIQVNRLRYDSKAIEFYLDIDENTPLNLIGDELRIKQILHNVLSNAFKYTERGSVRMSVSCEKPSAELKNSNDIIIVFRISDTGQGMTEDQLSMLFNKYTRFNLEANRATVGTGLGMSITKHLTELMDGSVSAESEAGKGSIFTIRIPQKLVDSQVCGKELADKLKHYRYQSTIVSKRSRILREYMPYGKVLVVDDVQTNLFVTRGMLLLYGIEADIASSGFHAIEKIKEGKSYDIILMDHMMPEMDGIQTVKIIRGLGYKNTIIALTANALVGQAKIFLENGFDGYISKPIDSRELNQILNEFIRNKKPVEVIKAARQEQKKKTVKSEVEKYFVMDAENALAVLEELFAGINKAGDEEFKSFEITVHGIKSALANIGEKHLSAAALNLEKAANEKNAGVLTEDTPAFISALKQLVDSIKSAEEKTGIKLDGENEAFLREKLKILKRACEEFDSNAAIDCLGELKQRKWPRSVDAFIDEINVHLLHSAFGKAIAAINGAQDAL